MARPVRPLGRKMLVYPAHDFFMIRGVYHQKIERLAVFVVIVTYQHVVEYSALFVGNERIANLPENHVGDPACKQFGQKYGCSRAFEPQPAHVRDIGHARDAARGLMLLDNRSELDRHHKTGEFHHPAAVRNMPIV